MVKSVMISKDREIEELK